MSHQQARANSRVPRVQLNHAGSIALVAAAIIFSILFLSLTRRGHASWSDFAHVTPATEKEYNLRVQLIPLDTGESRFKIKCRAVGFDEKLAWLIITEKALSSQEQRQRAHLWGSAQPEKAIRLKTLILPEGVGALMEEEEAPLFYEVELDAELMKTAYIYIDFPFPVKDGGYFYSIDLNAYLEHHRAKAKGKIKTGARS